MKMEPRKRRTPKEDRTKWLEDFWQGRMWDERHQWRLDELFFIKVELQTFLTCAMRDRVPRKEVDLIEQERERIAEGFYSPQVLAEMEREVDAQEINLYQLLLPPAVQNAVTASLPLCGPDKALQREVKKEYLGKFRKEFSDLPNKAKLLATPIGKKLSDGSKKTNGQSWKSSAIVGAYILNVYHLFKPFYRVSGRGLSITKPLKEGGQYPAALMKDITEFFSKDFPRWLGDLSVKDVSSRIQHGQKRLVQRKMYPPSKSGNRRTLVMKLGLSHRKPGTRPLAQDF